MSIVIITLTEEDGEVGLSARFDPPVEQLDNVDSLPLTHQVGLGMVSWAKEELAPDEEARWS
jgi:hypothetical protein